MSQTIIIEPDQDLKNVYKLNLATYTGTDVVDRSDSKDAIELLRILPTISLIITKAKVGDDETAILIRNFLKENNMDIPMIVLGECRQISSEVLTLKDPVSWDLLVKHAGTLLGVTEEKIKKQVKPDYTSISVHYFYEIDHTPCDVYIRIKKSPSEFQYVKRLREQDSFTSDDIQKYVKQGLVNFYIPRDYQQYFVTFVTNSIINRLESDLPLVNRLNTNSSAYEIVRDRIQNIGFTPEVTELAESNINSMISAVKEAPQLASLLKFLLTSKMSYAYQKAHLNCVIGNFILAKQSWYEDKHLKLFTYLSFFCDITLKSNLQMRINSQDELQTSELDDKERTEVINHAKNAAEILKTFEHSTEYLELVIMQHHGVDSGIGFPTQQNEEIHPIAKVFIISDAFVKLMLNPDTAKNKKEILTILYAQFTENDYQKIIKVLEQKIE